MGDHFTQNIAAELLSLIPTEISDEACFSRKFLHRAGVGYRA